jgi:hypothetical protein
MTKLPVALLLFLGAAHGPCQVLAAIETSDLAYQQTAAGSTLKFFDAVDAGVYKGSRPKSDADYRFLQSLHVKYIVDLQVIPFMTHFEQQKAKQYGITLIPGIMNTSPFSPSERHFNKIFVIFLD